MVSGVLRWRKSALERRSGPRLRDGIARQACTTRVKEKSITLTIGCVRDACDTMSEMDGGARGQKTKSKIYDIICVNFNPYYCNLSLDFRMVDLLHTSIQFDNYPISLSSHSKTRFRHQRLPCDFATP